MVDQWRAGDDLRDRPSHKHTDRAYRREPSPVSSRRAPPPTREGKSRGGDKAVATSSSTSNHRDRSREDKRDRGRARSPSPKPRPQLDSHPTKRVRNPLEEKIERAQKRERDEISGPPQPKRRRTRSPSPSHSHRLSKPKRRDSRSRDRSDRIERSGRPVERAFSPRRSPHRESRTDRGLELPATDSYVPSTRRRRSRTPPPRKERRSSPVRRSRSPKPRLDVRRGRERSRERERKPSPLPKSRKQVRSRSPAPKNSSPPPQKPNRKERKKMQQPTRPIQSIVGDRPASPLRPIPSFDADNGPGPMDNNTQMREQFPMHGMRAADFQNRPPRPHLDTRQPQSYAGSPQYMTPTSSHHGSPQSGSPYSGGRGGWGGQPQFHPHHGYVTLHLC
jgi:CTD kinase subunit alpha